jgi:signal transduction histidine kinase
VSLGVLAVLGLAGGLYVDSMPWWRVGGYLLLAVLAYLHGRHRDGRHAWRVLAAAGVAGGVLCAVISVGEGTSALLILGVIVVLPWLAGRYRRQQALLIAAERERVRQLEREREHVAERARLHERGRMAAELHDSLGHELALIALRAGALELSPEVAPEHQRAAGEMRASAVAATDRLRQVLEMLRDRDEVPPPVEEIVGRARAAGMTVALDGRPPMPELVDHAVRRVVREALTNAARHAAGAPVTIRLAAENHQVTVHIVNPASEPRGTGSGLVGLAERLRLLGGRLDTTHDEGRFELTARVPVA